MIWRTVLMTGMLLAGSLVALSDSGQTLGEGVADGEVTPIADIVSNPDSYKGKIVRVEGKVDAVCTNMGCWMDLKAPAGEKVQIKVQDGVIVFPASAVGKSAIAQGTVDVQELSREDYVNWLKHLAEENGKEFDEASVGEPPYRRVRVMGTGAVIK
ncbi:MAG: DUF4920 domain-containing protein [Acidobacteriota bacterium]|nr:MAG: DUF4920 domain-containing protein [Acidobacteriota bacterium]